MTDDLSGLPAELRRAAQCMQTHYPADKKAHSGDCVYWLLYETADVLVEKEMQKINEAHNHDLWASMEWGFIVGEKGQMNIQRARIEFAKTIKK